MTGPYDDIINLPRPVSITRPRMSIDNRAAQFSPFAALTGYDAAIKETARRTTEPVELCESDIDVLDRKLRILEESVADHPEVEVTYFKQDEKKKGGAYITSKGVLKRISGFEREIIFMNGDKIAISDILDMESALLENMQELC